MSFLEVDPMVFLAGKHEQEMGSDQEYSLTVTALCILLNSVGRSLLATKVITILSIGAIGMLTWAVTSIVGTFTCEKCHWTYARLNTH